MVKSHKDLEEIELRFNLQFKYKTIYHRANTVILHLDRRFPESFFFNRLQWLDGLEFLNGSQGRGAPARLRGERSWRRAAPAERFYNGNV